MVEKHEQPKVICIGWHKTGTSTMGIALLELGYKVVGARLDLADHLLKEDVSKALNVAAQFDALQDVPWVALYKELDQEYPGSKFILTVRDEQQWLQSASKHFQDSYSEMREWLYGEGVLKGNEKIYLDRYSRHYREVKEYFKDRPEDLMVMDFSAGDGWEKLCSFLGKPVPKRPFPHSNKGKHNYNWKDKSIAWLRLLVPKHFRKWRVGIMEKLGLHHGRDRFNNYYEHQELRKKKNSNRSSTGNKK